MEVCGEKIPLSPSPEFGGMPAGSEDSPMGAKLEERGFAGRPWRAGWIL